VALEAPPDTQLNPPISGVLAHGNPAEADHPSGKCPAEGAAAKRVGGHEALVRGWATIRHVTRCGQVAKESPWATRRVALARVPDGGKDCGDM